MLEHVAWFDFILRHIFPSYFEVGTRLLVFLFLQNKQVASYPFKTDSIGRNLLTHCILEYKINGSCFTCLSVYLLSTLLNTSIKLWDMLRDKISFNLFCVNWFLWKLSSTWWGFFPDGTLLFSILSQCTDYVNSWKLLLLVVNISFLHYKAFVARFPRCIWRSPRYVHWQNILVWQKVNLCHKVSNASRSHSWSTNNGFDHNHWIFKAEFVNWFCISLYEGL